MAEPTAGSRRDEGLARSLGLKEALSIGVGIMIGAGIFVFPGLAGGRAGPAAMVSFGIGGVIALLVALPTAELATAMPRSGGGYHFVSRGLGSFFGTLVGFGQWLGLVFASAFYLAGFGFYASDLLERLGWTSALPPGWTASVAGLALTATAILGTRKAGRLQDWIVAGLMIVLVGFLSYGLLDAFGAIGSTSLPGTFAPEGWGPVFGAAALVFTSYLGFQQIAVVSGEIRDPGRNLPRAVVGSVLIVMTLYVLTMFVAVSFATPAELRESGETALARVAEMVLGTTGGILISFAGLLATLSSANASILSSSRAVFAISRDGVAPEQLSRVSRRFRTPHIALLLTGVPIAGLAALGQIDILAEVASTLHLALFGLVCITMVVLRRRSPWWYQPSFRVPAGMLVATTGGLASFGLIAFMSPTTLLISGGVVAAGVLWFLGYARHARIPAPSEPRPLPVERPVRFLLTTEVPDPPGLPDTLMDAFGGHSVLLLGWAEVPEQSSSEQVRERLEEEATADLDRMADHLREVEIDVESDLAFAGDWAETVESVALEREADAVVVLRPGGEVRRILVPVPRLEMADGLARYTAWVAGHFGARVELMCPPDLDVAQLRQRFRSAGVPVADLHTAEGDADTAGAVLDAAASHDLLVVGGSEEEGAFGAVAERVLSHGDGPVMVVRLSRLFADEPDGEE